MGRLNARGSGRGSIKVDVGDVLIPELNVQELGGLIVRELEETIERTIDRRLDQVQAAQRAAAARGML